VEINAYNQSYNTSKISTGNNASDLKVQKENTSLDMNDFLALLVAQMSNQDAMNPMDNTEYVSQLAQFSSLQAMTDLANVAAQGQATSLIGKNVLLATYDNKGMLVNEEGIVEKVTINSGKVNLYVNDKLFSMTDVKEIKSENLNVVEELSNAIGEETEI
jgi:flagellar basal-body rod modification protein FlgD